MKIVYSPKFLKHSQGANHPESPKRLTAILDFLKNSDLRHEVVEPKPIKGAELVGTHCKKHVERIKLLSEQETSYPDNRFSRNTYEIAKLAAAASWTAAENAINENEFSFALVRPPGHHAGEDSFAGFCYFNNIAFAVKTLGKRTAIIDFDCHHGNGTQDIFHGDERVFYLSLHENPLVSYPGTGFDWESSSNVLNVPLDSETNDAEYLAAFAKALLQAKSFNPEIVAISAGFDTYAKCPIASLGIEKSETYFEIGKMIDETFGCLKFAVLEGGYYLPMLGQNVYNFLKAFEKQG